MVDVSNFSVLDAVLVVLSAALAALMLNRNIRDIPFWRATVTPLASIIGSGFLVVVPLLAHIAGPLSVWAITAIVLLSLWIGAALRFNIRHNGRDHSVPPGKKISVTSALERLSDIALALAYVISIAFYIRLMCGFILTGVNAYTPFNADILATLVLVFIGVYGYRRGLQGLERLEQYSVTIKLAIIASLLVGLIYFDGSNGYTLAGLPSPQTSLWDGLRLLGGMLLIVQGFETSKYLSAAYEPSLRSGSMLFAQLLAGIIYIAFVALAMPLMSDFDDVAPNETAIIGLSATITLVLPIMLVIAAAMSQFSAAIADTLGAGGVVEDESRGRVTARTSYLVISLLALALIWNSHIYQVISYASRAFAFYYLLQALLAARLAARTLNGYSRYLMLCAYGALSGILLLITLFATPVES